MRGMTVYAHRLEPGAWQRCGGNTGDSSGDDSESCVEFAGLPGGGMALRDTKNAGAGELRFDQAEWSAFMAAQKPVLE